MKKATDPRHLSRELALQSLFSKDFNNDNENSIDFNVEELSELDEIDTYNEDLYNSLVSGVKERKTDIDQRYTDIKNSNIRRFLRKDNTS